MNNLSRRRFLALFVLSILLMLLISACVTTPTPEVIVVTVPVRFGPTEQPAPTAEEFEEKPLINTPTPAPTATPGTFSKVVDQVARATGADRLYIFGLSFEDWFNLILSLAIFLLSVLILARLIYYLLGRAVARTTSKYDDLFLRKSRTLILAIVGVFSLEFGTNRLDFLSPITKQWLGQIYSATYVLIFSLMAWRLVDVVLEWYQNEIEPQHEEHQDDQVIPLVQRGLRFVIVLIAIIMILSINNVNVDVLIAALGIGGIAFSLAAQDSIANMISGVILMLDKPFRVGDRIEIQGLGTWGDVVDIGLRSTSIRTRDNRMVIVPNSKISNDQVINYTYPDPRYRIQMEIGIDDKQDVEQVRRMIVETVEKVDGVLPEMPVDALYIELGDSTMSYRIRWWIESYEDTRRIYDRVNTALKKTFNEAGIDMPNQSFDINILGRKKDS